MRTTTLRLGIIAFAVTAQVGLLGAPPASAGSPDRSVPGKARIPVAAQMATETAGSEPPIVISKQDFLNGAAKAGVDVSKSAEFGIMATTVCYSWNAWREGKNIFGTRLWRSNHRVKWCGDGSWIRSYAYTERWGETFMPGWNDKGLTQSGQQYGVGWNQYNSWTQRKFCLVEYFSCVQEANPYHNTTVYPNGAGRWN